MLSTLLQLAGLGAIVVGASLEFGAPGGVAGAGLGAVYVGLAMERD
jgi:hypothetical protein